MKSLQQKLTARRRAKAAAAEGPTTGESPLVNQEASTSPSATGLPGPTNVESLARF